MVFTKVLFGWATKKNWVLEAPKTADWLSKIGDKKIFGQDFLHSFGNYRYI